MSMHLAEIGRRVAPGAHAALIIDGAGYHVAARLAVPPNITLVRLPPYAPELNPLENVWEYLRGNKLAITVFESYDDIVDKSCTAWRFFADDSERVASITSCITACRRGHELRADRIGDGLAQDPVDLGLGGGIERPANHLVDRLQLIGMTRPPQCRGDALVEHPPHRQMNSAFAEALRKAIEPVDG